MDTTRQQVAIIGGGIGGCLTALELVKSTECTVLLFEKNKELMTETSRISPGRLGLGFHYADPSTALYALHKTLVFTKRYGKYRHGINDPLSHPLRRGRYFIMKNSLVTTANILNTYAAIKKEYARLVQMDSSYQLFGPPENLYRIMEPHEYQNDVVMDNIAIGIETAEELLNCEHLIQGVLEELQKYKTQGKLKILTCNKVVGLDESKSGGYLVTSALNSGIQRKIMVDTVVNASWYNISKINRMTGVSDEKRINRLKAIVTVNLPESLYNVSSMFFCMGPFCMFANKGDGVGMLTYAPETNIATVSSQDVTDVFSKALRVINYNSREKGHAIIQGVSRFIPDMKYAKLVKTELGIVQTVTDRDTLHSGLQIGNLACIHDPVHGGISKRDYSGVKVIHHRYIINACMKLMYSQYNAELIREIIHNQMLS